MGSTRAFRKRRRTDKKSKPNDFTSGSSAKQESGGCWNGFSKSINGLDKFEPIFGVSRTTFEYICSLVRDDLLRKPRFVSATGNLLSLPDQVAVALRRLSSGDSLVNVGDSFGLHHSAVSQITWRFVEAMEERGLHHLQWPSTDKDIKQIKYEFERISGLPNCCGAIGITHILMNLPASDPNNTTWLDHQKNHSMVLQGIVDPAMRFRDIVTGWPGKVDASSMFRSSSFYQLCENGKRLNGETLKLNNGSVIGEYMVGDTGFPLLPYLATPYDGDDLSILETEFNRRHFVTNQVAQRAFVRLKDKWRIIRGVMWRPDKHKLPRIILVCCILHNIAIDSGDKVDEDCPSLSHEHDPGYWARRCEIADMEGVILRDKLSLYACRSVPP
ncbi:protein ALP1-like [Punica granatum]|uniref:Protein ALP1-like n=2 Tax=Punica granatum TaxID=22663 RepID=A0A6P8DDG3_PUNGR|nr:protein ALP1-like [Punica granatum]XP_031389353.1 protein ALP1-like [Punica granatum]XP_031389354.1 protein ALP1-like [Punica granatum]OWM89316.1 hypothetical protein CDL15_Pgr024061 [Punica granatum]PKI61681.1 hypothetical protein CRG98_017905 [Punica granatum]